MASFEIADCPTNLRLTEQDKAGKKVQTGTLTLTVRSATERQRTGRIKVEPDQGAKPDWFALQGAPATSPLEFEQDFAAKGTQTIRVTVTVPAGEAPKSCLLRLVVMEETDPGNDFVKGPNVAFEIKAWSAPRPAPGPPWWIFVAAGVALLLIVGGGVGGYFYFRPPGHPEIVGLDPGVAKTALIKAGFTEANIKIANDSQTNGQRRGTVARAEYPDSTHVNVFLDPGLSHPEIVGLDSGAAKTALIKAGFAEGNIQVANDSQTSGHRLGVVTRVQYPDDVHVVINLDPGAPAHPDLVGLQVDGAKAALMNAGFPEANIQVLTDRQTSGRDRGTVVRADYPDAMHVNITLDPGVPVDQEVMLVNVKTGKCLTIAGGTLPDNNIVAVQFDCDGDPSRRWRLNETRRGIYQIRNVKTEKCLTIAGGVSTENNVRALQFDCDRHPSRTWRLDYVSGASYQIRNVQTDKCLTIAGGTLSDNNIEALQFDCDDDTSRRWTVN